MSSFSPISNSEIQKGFPPDSLLLQKIKDNFDYLKANIGSGGGTFKWNEEINAPIKAFQNGYEEYSFEATLGQKLLGLVRVPSGFGGGFAPKISFFAYSSSTNAAHSMRMAVLVTLLKQTGPATDSSYQQTFTVDVAGTTVANLLRKFEVALADAGGSIGGQAIEAGDLIKVELSRSVSDVLPTALKMIPETTQLSFAQ